MIASIDFQVIAVDSIYHSSLAHSYGSQNTVIKYG